MKARPPAIIGYARTSSGSEDIAFQRSAIADAAARASVALSFPVFEDDAVLGDAAERSGLAGALGAVFSGGPGSTLIIREISRVGRDIIDILETGRALLDHGVRVIAVAEGIDTATDVGRDRLGRELAFKAMFAEEENPHASSRRGIRAG